MAAASLSPLLAKEEKAPKLHQPTAGQPYSYQEIKTETQKSVRLVGQAYRPKSNQLVLELLPQQRSGSALFNPKLGRAPEAKANLEIQNVRIKTPDGKVYPASLRRLPADFLPTARKNYQYAEGEAPKAKYIPGTKSR